MKLPFGEHRLIQQLEHHPGTHEPTRPGDPPRRCGVQFHGVRGQSDFRGPGNGTPWMPGSGKTKVFDPHFWMDVYVDHFPNGFPQVFQHLC